MNGQMIVNNSIFGKIDSTCETTDGRNIGQMQAALVGSLDTFLERVPQVIGQIPTRSHAEVATQQAVSQMIRKQWGGLDLSVFVQRDGRKAIQGVNYRDIVAATQTYVGNVWDAASK